VATELLTRAGVPRLTMINPRVNTPPTPSRSRKIRKTLTLFCSTFDIEGHNLPRRSIWKFDSGMFTDVQDSFWLPPKESKLKF
jgi:hypothetical protein